MSVKIRAITEDDLTAYCQAFVRGFGAEVHEGEEDRVRHVLGLDRTHAAFDDSNRIVGTMAAYTMQLAVPGEVDVASAGLSRVTVATSHRRQGILSQMIDVHFADSVAHREAVSILWASEASIYGRFGFGQATENAWVVFDTTKADIVRPARPDTVDLIDAAEAQKVLPELRERCRRKRPGIFQRSPVWWEHRSFPDHEWMREGMSSRRYVVASRNGDPVGYATYRQKMNWTDDDLADGKISVETVAAIDDDAVHTLWWFLSNVDLFPHVEAWLQPTDTIVPWIANNVRAIRRKVNDGIHLRVLDVADALSTRHYQQPGEVTFAVDDPRLGSNTGTYRLTIDQPAPVGDDGNLPTYRGTCEQTEAEPQLTISPKALGTLYLGSGRTGPLALVGEIRGQRAAVSELERLMGWPVAAFCDEGF